MTKSKLTHEFEQLNDISDFSESKWGSIKPEYAARMRLQNQFKSGIDIAKYTATLMRKDMEAYDADSSAYTQSLGCWHGFIAQQKMISIKKHFGTTHKRYLYLSGWMIAALRSEFGPLPDQSMHEKTSVAALIKELYTFLRQADARELGDLFRELDAASDSNKPTIQEKIENFKNKTAVSNPIFSLNILQKEKQKNVILLKKAEEEKQKRKALERRLSSLQNEKKKRIELEKKLAALESEQRKERKGIRHNEIGSGFYVSKFRHIITNEHVVNKCNKITVGDSMNTQVPADLIASDRRNDLAILQTISMEMASIDTKSFVQKLAIQIVPVLSGGLMRSEDVTGGEQIYVAGYPLGNMVSDQMKLTDGIVSATKGLDNNVSQFEISSVIRKGNSGGPIYDSRGNIVGVVVERFNVNRSDNVNFAIKGSTVKQFLSAHNVSTKWSNRQDDMSTKDIYKIASKQTVMVVCHH